MTEHVHRFRLDEPDGEYTVGRCACGAETKPLRNSEPDMDELNERRWNGALRSSRSHCRNGHPLSGDNLYVNPRGERSCQACKRALRARREGVA